MGGDVLIAFKSESFINTCQVYFSTNENLKLIAIEGTTANNTKQIFICSCRPPDNNDLSNVKKFIGQCVPGLRKDSYMK